LPIRAEAKTNEVKISKEAKWLTTGSIPNQKVVWRPDAIAHQELPVRTYSYNKPRIEKLKIVELGGKVKRA
jgi:hypothetical protein